MGGDAKMLHTMAQVTLAVTRIFEEFLKMSLEASLQKEQSRSAKMLVKALENGEAVNSRAFNPILYNDIQNGLMNTHPPTPHCIMHDTTTDKLLVFFREEDSKIVDYIFDKTLRRDVGIVDKATLNKKTSGDELFKINGLSEQEYEAFKFEAGKRNLTFAIERNEATNKVDIYYGMEDKTQAQMREVLNAVSINTVGRTSRYFDGHEKDRMEKMIETTMMDSEKRIVSASNPAKNFILINKDNCVVYKNGKVVDEIDKTHTGFSDKIYEKIKEMPLPIVVGQGELNLTPEQLMDRVSEASRNYENTRLADIEYRTKLLVEKKFSLDNGDFSEIVTSFYDPNVTFLEFFEHELVNDNNDAEIDTHYDELAGAAKWLDNCTPEEKEYAKNIGKEIFERNEEITGTIIVEEKTKEEESLEEIIDRANEEERDNDIIDTMLDAELMYNPE